MSEVICININKQYPTAKTPAELEMIVLSIWRLKQHRAERVQYAFGIAQGIIREVFIVTGCIPAPSTTVRWWRERAKAQGIPFPEGKLEGRMELLGVLAPESIRDQYIGQTAAVQFRQQPIQYCSLEEVVVN
jgi:hypothetical protein